MWYVVKEYSTLSIVNDRISSSINGIGTYVKQMILCFSGLNVSTNILEFNSESNCFQIEDRNNIRYFCFPDFGDGCIHNHFLVIDKFLRLYIKDSSENIFIFNYSPASLLVERVKMSYPLSRLVYVVHDLYWTSYLLGDLDTYVEILSNRDKEDYYKKYCRLYERYDEEVRICSYSDIVVSLSTDMYNLLKGYYTFNNNKLVLIPNALFEHPIIWTEEEKQQFKSKMLLGDEKILLFVGRLVEQKGIYVYIEAFKEIVKKYPKCRLVVIGAVLDWSDILKRCYSIFTHIHFTGLLSSDEIKKWYQIADIGIFPSYVEQCSYVGLEMLSYCFPIIASDGFGVRCMFNDKNAYIVPIGDRRNWKNYKDELVKMTLYLLCNDLKKYFVFDIRSSEFSMDKNRELYKCYFCI